MPTGDPIAVTLVESASADSLIVASKTISICSLSDNLNAVSSAEYFRTLGVGNTSQTNTALTVVIINCLMEPLVFGDPWLKHGDQLGYPDSSNRVGTWANFQDKWNILHGAGQAGLSRCANQIPAARFHPLKPGSLLYGAGAFRFAKSVGLYGSDGAMSFTCGSDVMGFSWVVYPGGTRGYAAVAADATSYPSLEDFYNATAGAGKSIDSHQTTRVDVRARMGYRLAKLDASHHPTELWTTPVLSQASFDHNETVLTVSVREV